MTFPTPTRGASLLLAFRSQKQRFLIIGSGPLAASRAFAALEADFEVVILAKGGLDTACAEIRWRVERQECSFVDFADHLDPFLSSSLPFSLATITDTVIGPSRRPFDSAKSLYHTLKSHRIPVNTADIPDLCDYTFMSTHRLDDTHTGERSPLQVGVTTNGQGCRLASRIRRDIVARLPKEVGRAVANLGNLRRMAKADTENLDMDVDVGGEVNDDSGLVSTPNSPVPIRGPSETESERIHRRMKWVAQLSEYWPIPKISNMSENDMTQFLLVEKEDSDLEISTTSLDRHRRGRILLVGSGPGHPSLLTIATHRALTEFADLVLSDKLVPDSILSLIPKTVQVRIARKFPGNADGAQQEMMEAAIEAANQGLTVVRLKQGDPVIYGRAGEEVLYFRKHGYEPLIIPGITSSISAPTFAKIPITQRGVSESFIICTGIGRRGKQVQLPGYERSRTLVILMGVARISQVVDTLLKEDYGSKKKRDGPVYPVHTPIAIIERASMPDQRVITSTLENIVSALESCGEQRPPGLMVIGWSVLALHGEGDVGVLDCEGEEEVVRRKDEDRVKKWLGDRTWRVEEGIDDAWNDLVL